MKDGALVKARKACEEVPAQRSIEAEDEDVAQTWHKI